MKIRKLRFVRTPYVGLLNHSLIETQAMNPAYDLSIQINAEMPATIPITITAIKSVSVSGVATVVI